MVFPFSGRFSETRIWGGNDNPNARPCIFPSPRQGLVNGFGEGDAETLLGQLDVMHGERSGFAVPFHLLKAKLLSACGPPPSSGLPDPKGSVFAEDVPDASGLETVDEIEDHPLVFTADFVEETRMMLERL